MFKVTGSHKTLQTITMRLGMVLALLVGLLGSTMVFAAGEIWSSLGGGMNDQVHALAFDSSGNLYAGGSFTTAGGVTVNRVAKWNGSAWSPLGSGMNNEVYALAFDGSGNLYAGGNFTTAGGVSANRIAKWNGSAWSPLGSGMNAEVYALVVDGSGNLYAGGSFTSPASRIAKWDGASWSALGVGTNGRVNALKFDASGNLYAGGSFTTADGVPMKYVAKWNGSLWSALSSEVSSTVRALAVDGSGNLYAGGDFANASGMAASRIAKWDGTSWSPLGSGMGGTTKDVYALAIDSSGSLYAGGVFTSAGGVSTNRIAKWNGSAWSALGSGVDNASRALAIDGSGALNVGGSFITAGGVTTNYIAKWGASAMADFNLTPSSVNENQPAGTVVGVFNQISPGPGETFTYTLVAGTGSSDNSSFGISDDELLTAAIFDFETRNSYSIRVRSISSGGSYSEKAFTITVWDVNEPPVITEGASVDVTMDKNGSPRAFSLTLHAADEDVATLAWSISSPAGHGAASASGTGASKVIGYTPQMNYTGTDNFEVKVEDSTGGVDTIIVHVTILTPTTTRMEPGADRSLFCTGENTTISISLTEVVDLFGYQFVVHYDPSLVSAAGAFVNTFFDTSTNASVPTDWIAACNAGQCKFAVSKVEPGAPVTGSGTVAQITLTGLSAGTFDITLSQDILSDRDAQVIAHDIASLSLTVCGYANVSGTVSLQGRATPVNVGTVTLTDLGGVFEPYSANFNATTGAFTISNVKVMPGGSNYQFDAAHGLYLGNRMTRTLSHGDNYTAPATRLLGGDANNDGLIDLGDLTCVGGSFGGTPVACGMTGNSDLNADGFVNILDLVLPGGNYGLTTPRSW